MALGITLHLIAILFVVQSIKPLASGDIRALYSGHDGVAIESGKPKDKSQTLVTFYKEDGTIKKATAVPENYYVIGVTNDDELVVRQNTQFYSNLAVTKDDKPTWFWHNELDTYLEFKNGWFFGRFGSGLAGYSNTEGFHFYGELGHDRYAVSRTGLLVRLHRGVDSTQLVVRPLAGKNKTVALNVSLVTYDPDDSCCILDDRYFICLLDIGTKVDTLGIPVLTSGTPRNDIEHQTEIICMISLENGAVKPMALVVTYPEGRVPDPGDPRSLVAVGKQTVVFKTSRKVWFIRLPIK